MESKTLVLKVNLDAGEPGPEHFDIVTSTVVPGDLKDGQVLVQILAMSVDPYLRSRMKNAGSIPGSTGGKKPGDVMEGFVSGRIAISKSPDWVEGDLFGANLPFSTVQMVTVSSSLMWKLTGMIDEARISYGVGVLGMPGATAYGGLIDILQPKEGETIFISGAAGAVGSLVGQIAKNVFKCTVIGSCGGPEKCELLKSKFGFDHAIDYKKTPDLQSLKAALLEIAPTGIDMYFENVGGYHFEAAFQSLHSHGRIAVCGGISQYNEEQPASVSINPLQMIYTFQRIEGFVSTPWLTGKRGSFLRDMATWLNDGKLAIQETFFDDIENWPAAFKSLFTGANSGGKVVVRINSKL